MGVSGSLKAGCLHPAEEGFRAFVAGDTVPWLEDPYDPLRPSQDPGHGVES